MWYAEDPHVIVSFFLLTTQLHLLFLSLAYVKIALGTESKAATLDTKKYYQSENRRNILISRATNFKIAPRIFLCINILKLYILPYCIPMPLKIYRYL